MGRECCYGKEIKREGAIQLQTNLYFVRHAHSTYTPDEWGRPLSNKGQMDAERITQRLKKEDIQHVLSSPYKRAMQTVQGIADLIGKEVILDQDFRERNLASVPVEDFDKAIKKLWEEPSFSYEGGESNIDAKRRGVKATYRILEKYEGENVVIGTHGNIMVLIMNYFDSQYDVDFWQSLAMPDIYRMTFVGLRLKEINRIE